MASVLVALPQLSCCFHPFKVIVLLLVHFIFGFAYFVVWWLCLATYSLVPACWIHSLGSWSVLILMCICTSQIKKKVLFIVFFPAILNTLGCWSKCSPLFSPWVGCAFWAFPHKVGLAHSGPTALSAVTSIWFWGHAAVHFLAITWLWHLGKSFEVFHILVPGLPGSHEVTRFLPNSF